MTSLNLMFCAAVLLNLLYFFSGRLKNQRKAVVTTVDKKIPNGILEEQGNIVDCKSTRLAVKRSIVRM